MNFGLVIDSISNHHPDWRIVEASNEFDLVAVQVVVPAAAIGDLSVGDPFPVNLPYLDGDES